MRIGVWTPQTPPEKACFGAPKHFLRRYLEDFGSLGLIAFPETKSLKMDRWKTIYFPFEMESVQSFQGGSCLVSGRVRSQVFLVFDLDLLL